MRLLGFHWNRTHAFLLGFIEARGIVTTNPGEGYIGAYDWGREWFHRLTSRVYEP